MTTTETDWDGELQTLLAEEEGIPLGAWEALADEVEPIEAVESGASSPETSAKLEGLLADMYGDEYLRQRAAARERFQTAARRYDSRSTLRADYGDVGIYRGAPIEFAEGAWAAFNRTWMDTLARDESHPRHTRLLFAAMARVQPRSGLAYFQAGELREILGKVDAPCAANRVTDALSKARELGLIRVESDSQHVYLDRQHVQRGR